MHCVVLSNGGMRMVARGIHIASGFQIPFVMLKSCLHMNTSQHRPNSTKHNRNFALKHRHPTCCWQFLREGVEMVGRHAAMYNINHVTIEETTKKAKVKAAGFGRNGSVTTSALFSWCSLCCVVASSTRRLLAINPTFKPAT